MITGKDLIAWGHQPGGWFGDAIAAANSAASEGMELEGVKALVDGMKPPPVIPLRPPDRAAFAQMIEAAGRCTISCDTDALYVVKA